ncbi:hypothetical protein L9G16_04215 [Shewanella sp. A25]|nr:hypothetical protein [Shewanella shenzhenensis]
MEIRKSTSVTDAKLQTDKASALTPAREAGRSSGATTVVETSSNVSQQAVLTRWVTLASISSAMGESEHSARTLQQLSRQLKSLDTQLVQDFEPEKSAQKVNNLVKGMKRQLSEGGVDYRLRANEHSDTSATVVTKTLNKSVDFLSRKTLDEQVSIVMGRSAKAVTLKLEAGDEPAQNLRTLQQAFAKHQIDVSVGENQSLQFSARGDAASALKETWQMMGTGVRIAAGNPVAINLGEPSHALDNLQEISQDENAQLENYRQEINRLQRRIKMSLDNIDGRRQDILQRLQQLQTMTPDEEGLQQISDEVEQIMRQPEKHSVSILLSNANVTRNLVTFSLSYPD